MQPPNPRRHPQRPFFNLPALRRLVSAFGLGKGAAMIQNTVARSIVAAVVLLASAAMAGPAGRRDVAWPAQSRQCRPWAYNWWLGSAVDKANLTRELERYRQGGLGGVHVVPIYGAKGAEERYLTYLSPKWMEMLAHALAEGERLDLGVDMTTGTGWCFGGPHVARDQGCRQIAARTIALPPGGKLDPKAAGGDVLYAAAVGSDGKHADITAKIKNGRIDYPPAAGEKLAILSARLTGQAVKRSAPGGAGPMLNPFSPAVMEDYLKPFTAAFDAAGAPRPRAMYHDSFEYSGNWSDELFDEFPARRGYDLRGRLDALAGLGDADTVARVKGDYRETLSDLMIEKSFPVWTRWCRNRGIFTRNQAHGSPGNLLDLYALADIPETEMFGRGSRDPLASGFDPARFTEGDRDILVSKFASSAAHVAGKPLTSAETCTWMAEHFCETLEETKCFVDLMFAAGVNHVFYHGTVYSPDDAAWPGWLFYASTQMNPRNPIWRDAPALNAYIARCQSVLQAGRPDNDVLLYWPVHDLWHSAGGMNINCSVHGAPWFKRQPIGELARRLWDAGISFDYVSDRLLAGATGDKDGVRVAGQRYRAVVLPATTHIPVGTMKKLVELAEAGVPILCDQRLPSDVPGLGRLAQRRSELNKLLERAKGKLQAGKAEDLIAKAGIVRERLVDQAGVMVIRRRLDDGRYYLIINQSAKPIDGPVPLACAAKGVAILDPMTGRIGRRDVLVAARRGNDERGGDAASTKAGTSVDLYLEPGHSIILRTFDKDEVDLSPFVFVRPGRKIAELSGPWQIEFLAGGPTLPKPYRADKLASWTACDDVAAEAFAGTALYRTTFDAPAGSEAGKPLVLDLGKVCHSARVRLNGRDMGVVFMPPYRLSLDKLQPRGNTLEIEVTNLAANRIRDLDGRKVAWRVFNDINLVNIGYKGFDASKWPVFESGLIGPVTVRR